MRHGPAYYNENDPNAAQWLRNLIAGGHIAPGDVDERSIVDVRADDLRGYAQCHFFAGIGGWSEALRLAGWPDDRPVWTGSCPCQPFSAAGKRKAGADERHLWPVWLRLIQECRPNPIFGEQVEAAIGLGWLDRVFADLEAEGYACGSAVLGSHSVGAPNIRQRLWWVADTGCERRDREPIRLLGRGPQQEGSEASGRGGPRRLAHPHEGQRGRLAVSEGCESDRTPPQRQQSHGQPEPGGDAGGMGDPDSSRRQGFGREGQKRTAEPSATRGMGNADIERLPERPPFWDAYDLIPCLDGKARRVEPGVEPLATGVQGRVVKLRAYGNAINPHVAAEFIRAYRDVTEAA